MTNRGLVLAALAVRPSTITGALRSRDTRLMIDGLRAMGTGIVAEEAENGRDTTTLQVSPGPFHGATVDCGLAGTVMRFLPPLAALATDTVIFDGDPQARRRPLTELTGALKQLGIALDGSSLPLRVHGTGQQPLGGTVDIDASASSQFVSALLLAGARYRDGITVTHTGESLPSQPHIDMTVAMVRDAGVRVEAQENRWRVWPGPIAGRHWQVEPDLTNATPFLAAAALTGGRVIIHRWPPRTCQPGDAIRGILERMGATVRLVQHPDGAHDLEVHGPTSRTLRAIRMDMSDLGELVPTVAALALFAEGTTTLTGIAHLRGHETDRLRALSTEINRIGGNCEELPDGLRIHGANPRSLHSAQWESYADHRMATAGAIVGLRVPGIRIPDIATTAKTLPGFEIMWEDMVTHGTRGSAEEK